MERSVVLKEQEHVCARLTGPSMTTHRQMEWVNSFSRRDGTVRRMVQMEGEERSVSQLN